MRGDDPSIGTALGKALAPLEGERGTILVLSTLQ